MPAPDLARDTLLAFDTSTETLSVAVLAGSQRWVRNLPGGAAASAALLPAIESMLAEAGRVMKQVAAIAFGRGPGAFTGLRTSCAVAQGLATGLDCPVIPIDSLLIVAEQARLQAGAAVSDIGADPDTDTDTDTRKDTGTGTDTDWAVLMDARMGEIYAARYRWQGSAWQVRQLPGLWAPDALGAAWAESPPGWWSGTAQGLFDDRLRLACPPQRRIDEGPDRAAALLSLARQAWMDGCGLDASQALPLYLRDKVALTTQERAAAKAAAA
jgi:tRNA threonylcarbamoyladenosine biosynthesis protein TsaB